MNKSVILAKCGICFWMLLPFNNSLGLGRLQNKKNKVQSAQERASKAKKALYNTCPTAPKNLKIATAQSLAVSRSFTDIWSISKELFDYITHLLPQGSTILELGSGWGTGELAKKYTMYSIENDSNWLHKYKSTYIFAPIIDGWYDTAVLSKQLPEKYDLILIDGPPAAIGRNKFYTNIHLFNTNVPMIFDDVNRPDEKALLTQVAAYLNRPFKICKSRGKQFGVILP
ncbi:MAG: hypothetical protein AB7F19_04500 [Candidatus Babeliales bacterium]